MTTLRRPRKCGNCTMFGHNTRKCHLSFLSFDGERWPLHGGTKDWSTVHLRADNMSWALSNYDRHCAVNQRWIAAGGEGHTVAKPHPSIYKNKKRSNGLITDASKRSAEKLKKVSCDCPICMEPIGDKNKFVTACGHTFCGTCILTNYQRNTSCPLCRGEIAPNVNFEPAKTKFKRLLAPRELMDLIHDRLGKTLIGIEDTLLKVAEQESAGETTPSLSMSLAQPILRGLLRYTQELHDHVVENV